MDFFYDRQIKRYLTQFMRLMSNFSYQDANGKLRQVPVRFGDMNRQVAQIINKNSENILQSAPFIACYIKGMEFARDRIQDPTFVSKLNIRERAYDEEGQEYLNIQGANYTVERIMPTPFNLEFTADIWCTNLDQKLQLLEQLLVLFNPSMEIQTSSNFIDWTSLSLVELTGLNFTSRSIPQGLEQDIDIATLTFKSPIWLTPPAKVKKLGIITKIITSIFDESTGTADLYRKSGNGDIADFFSGRTPIAIDARTLGNLGLLVLDNTAKLVAPTNRNSSQNTDPFVTPNMQGSEVSWLQILDQYPGQFIAGVSQIRLQKPDGNEIVGYISLNPTDDFTMQINWDEDTIPMNTLLPDLQSLYTRGTVDAIIDPQRFNPRPLDNSGNLSWPTTDTRYLLLDEIVEDVEAWKNQDGSYFRAAANDIIQWDGVQWNIIFTSSTNSDPVYITNSRTGVQYTWDGDAWMKSYDGVYTPLLWRLVL